MHYWQKGKIGNGFRQLVDGGSGDREKKALIVIGHVLSEQSGMKLRAEWMKSFVKEVRVDFVAAPEPFWNPENPTPA
jgi:hypothetical protein